VRGGPPSPCKRATSAVRFVRDDTSVLVVLILLAAAWIVVLLGALALCRSASREEAEPLAWAPPDRGPRVGGVQ
jgi:hypothetical protein